MSQTEPIEEDRLLEEGRHHIAFVKAKLEVGGPQPTALLFKDMGIGNTCTSTSDIECNFFLRLSNLGRD